MSKLRVDRLALEGKHAGDALVDTAEGFAADQRLEGLEAECELAEGERALTSNAAVAQALEVGFGVFGA